MALDPANAGWQRVLSISHEMIGDVLVVHGSWEHLRQISRDPSFAVLTPIEGEESDPTKGITAALCGAKRPEQIRETAAAMNVTLTDNQLFRIDLAISTASSSHANRPSNETTSPSGTG